MKISVPSFYSHIATNSTAIFTNISTVLKGSYYNTLFYSYYNSTLLICTKVLCHPLFFNLHKTVNVTQQSRQIQENKIKIIVANSGMKHKSETMLKVVRVLALDFILYFVTV